MEEFKILEDYPAYRISNKGRIQSRWRFGKFYSTFITEDEDIWKDMNTHLCSNGYPRVCLRNGKNKGKNVRIHTLVAHYFIGPKPKTAQLVRHLDSNKLNNNVTNLAYGTYVDNENDKILNGTWGNRIGGAKLTPSQIKDIRVKLQNGKSQNDLANEYGVSRPTITRINNYSIWKDIT